MNRQTTQNGFTLIEMAIVLVIPGLLLGGVLAPISAQKEQQRRSENQQLLDSDYSANSDEGENSDLDSCYVSHGYVNLSGSEFDDQIVWLSPNALFNHMISAGVLP